MRDKALVVDASVFVAMAMREESHHAEAKEFVAEMRQRAKGLLRFFLQASI